MDFISNYQIRIKGNELVGYYLDIKKAKRKFVSLGKRGFYVELWACHKDGSCYLLDYMN